MPSGVEHAQGNLARAADLQARFFRSCLRALSTRDKLVHYGSGDAAFLSIMPSGVEHELADANFQCEESRFFRSCLRALSTKKSSRRTDSTSSVSFDHAFGR